MQNEKKTCNYYLVSIITIYIVSIGAYIFSITSGGMNVNQTNANNTYCNVGFIKPSTWLIITGFYEIPVTSIISILYAIILLNNRDKKITYILIYLTVIYAIINALWIIIGCILLFGFNMECLNGNAFIWGSMIGEILFIFISTSFILASIQPKLRCLGCK